MCKTKRRPCFPTSQFPPYPSVPHRPRAGQERQRAMQLSPNQRPQRSQRPILPLRLVATARWLDAQQCPGRQLKKQAHERASRHAGGVRAGSGRQQHGRRSGPVGSCQVHSRGCHRPGRPYLPRRTKEPLLGRPVLRPQQACVILPAPVCAVRRAARPRSGWGAAAQVAVAVHGSGQGRTQMRPTQLPVRHRTLSHARAARLGPLG